MLIYPAILTRKRAETRGSTITLSLPLMCRGLFAFLNRAEQEGLVLGVKVCHVAPSISHLIFAGNSLILVHANRAEATQLQHILDQYE